MTTIVTRSGKGSPLTNAEVDQNFINLEQDKLELIVNSTVSGATITPDSGDSQYNVTALAIDATFAAPSGTPVNGKSLILRIKDDGTSRTLSWNAVYRSVGDTLPAATTAGKVTYIGLKYNSDNSTWDCLAVMTEA